MSEPKIKESIEIRAGFLVFLICFTAIVCCTVLARGCKDARPFDGANVTLENVKAIEMTVQPWSAETRVVTNGLTRAAVDAEIARGIKLISEKAQ